jgi:hypothetical protein
MDVFESGHCMQLNDGKIPTNDIGKDWHDEHGLHDNPIWDKTASGFRSAKRTLAMIKLWRNSGDFMMYPDTHDKLWLAVLEQVNATKNLDSFGGNKELQKQQYLSYRNEIINFFVTAFAQTSWRWGETDGENWINKPYPYWNELAALGIDPHAIFDKSIEHKNREIDYQSWLWGGRSQIYGWVHAGSGRNTSADVNRVLNKGSTNP